MRDGGETSLHPHFAYLAAAAAVGLTHAASGLTRLLRFIMLHHFFHFGVTGTALFGIPSSVGRQGTLDTVREVGICGGGGNLEKVGGSTRSGA
jgi:hypothetical protein